VGSAEIRVFSAAGDAYAAPNLIYHYVRTHWYKPPEEFLRAMREGARPPSSEYFESLNKLVDFGWKETLIHPGDTRDSVPEMSGSRFERADGEVRRVAVQIPVHLDQD
jgi:hypothetical protein